MVGAGAHGAYYRTYRLSDELRSAERKRRKSKLVSREIIFEVF